MKIRRLDPMVQLYKTDSNSLTIKEIILDTFLDMKISIGESGGYPGGILLNISGIFNRTDNSGVENMSRVLAENIKNAEFTIEFTKNAKSLLHRIYKMGYTISHFHLWELKLQIKIDYVYDLNQVL